MQRTLPPLNSIRAFEAAGRSLSFSKAANELHVTHGAVSKQIKILESYLDVDLFKRGSQGISLTNEGEQYLKCIGTAFNEIDAATQSLKGQPVQQRLTIEAPPTFAKLWLVPMLGEFRRRYNSIQIEVITQNEQTFHQSDACFYIRHFPLDTAPDDAELIRAEELHCLVSPSIISEEQLANGDIGDIPLIDITGRENVWEQAFPDKPSSLIQQQTCCRFGHYYLAIEAAQQGFGVCLAPDYLADRIVKSGKLVRFANIQIKTQYGYFSQFPRYKSTLTNVHLFSYWLKEMLSDL